MYSVALKTHASQGQLEKRLRSLIGLLQNTKNSAFTGN
jgi:hypothetical protein